MNTNKAILIVSFGTSYKETRKKTINKIENNIAEAFPDYKIYSAFTSRVIINKILKTENIKIPTVREALETIKAAGIKDIIVQPTHVINGFENDDMLSVINEYADNFNSIKIGKPLLSNENDYKELIEIVHKEFSFVKNNEILVCMGHGTGHHANSTYPALDYMFKEKGYENFFVASVEGYPYLKNILGRLKDFRPSKIYITPIMIVAGNHALIDMAGDDENSWKSILEKEGFNVECIIKGLGEYEGISRMFINHIKNAEN